MNLAEIGAGFEPAAGLFYKLWIEACHLGDALDHAVGCGLVAAALDESGGVLAFGVVDNLLHGLRSELLLAFKVGGGDGGERDYPWQRRKDLTVTFDGG